MKKWLSDFWVWFKSFFNEEEGASTTRALSWLWVTTLCISIFFVSAYSVIKTKEAKLPDIPVSYITVTGLFLASKVGQRIWGENTPEPTEPTEPPKP